MLYKIASSKPGCVHVVFMLPVWLCAEQVSVVGDFNGWNSTAIPLRRNRYGTWQAELDLVAGGGYAFRYCVDGRWLVDHYADGLSAEGGSSWVDTASGIRERGAADEIFLLREEDGPPAPLYPKRSARGGPCSTINTSREPARAPQAASLATRRTAVEQSITVSVHSFSS